MRILHMIPDIGIANGIMSVILNFAKSMPDDIKFDIVYFHETEKTRHEDIEALGGRVFKIAKPAPQDIILKKYDSFFKEHEGEWEALHIHAPHFAAFVNSTARKYGVKKVCVHCHSSEYSLKRSSLKNQVLSWYAKYFIKDKFACSKLAGDFWYGNKPYKIINNAIDCEKYSFSPEVRERTRKQLGLTDELAVGHIGRTDIPQKNHSYLLSVFYEICQMNEKSKLFLVGAEETEKLVAAAERGNIRDRVVFMGRRDDVAELLNAFDVFVFPSTNEGLPVSLIEAQAAGLPVIKSSTVTDEVCVTDLVKNKSLSLSPLAWAMDAVDLAVTKREDTLPKLRAAGWDLSSISKELVDYYTKGVI